MVLTGGGFLSRYPQSDEAYFVSPPRFYPNKSYLDGAIENQLPATIFGSTANAVFFASKFGVLN